MKKNQEFNKSFIDCLCTPDFSKYLDGKDISHEGITLFQKVIYDYFKENGRSFSWRNTTNPYHIVVSEIMLQQTQTDRVKDKFEQFINEFPTLQTLANASLAKVLAAWQGLGYNRRAQSLHLFAQRVELEFNGCIPTTPEVLQSFKGIGPATAASICAFAFNSPTIFIETNIRAVFIFAFFRNENQIQDNQIQSLVIQTLDHQNPRIWYYALMDYGVMLKKLYPNPNKKSAHYSIQSKFEGSDRQIRGLILKLLLEHSLLSLTELAALTQKDVNRVAKIAEDLLNEKLIVYNNHYSLPV